MCMRVSHSLSLYVVTHAKAPRYSLLTVVYDRRNGIYYGYPFVFAVAVAVAFVIYTCIQTASPAVILISFAHSGSVWFSFYIFMHMLLLTMTLSKFIVKYFVAKINFSLDIVSI